MSFPFGPGSPGFGADDSDDEASDLTNSANWEQHPHESSMQIFRNNGAVIHLWNNGTGSIDDLTDGGSDHVNFLALVKGHERYVLLFQDEMRADALRLLGRMASNPEFSFTWYDAAVLSQKIRRQVGDVMSADANDDVEEDEGESATGGYVDSDSDERQEFASQWGEGLTPTEKVIRRHPH